MTVKTILPFGDPILRKKARPVEELNDRTLKILDDMAETLYASDGRAGLAAPQVGYEPCKAVQALSDRPAREVLFSS